MATEKQVRRETLKHLWRMHGQFQIHQGDRFSAEELQEIHEIFHSDNYLCPPHSHREVDPFDSDPFEIGEVELAMSEDYFAQVVKAVKEEE